MSGSAVQPFIGEVPVTGYALPNRMAVMSSTSLSALFSSDFGGVAVSTSKWDVIDGGLAAVTQGQPVTQFGGAPLSTVTQGKIGSGTTGITDSVANSALTVSMGTTLGAERWYLSTTAFAGKEDILVILSRSQALAANSIFIGLVEVDSNSLVPLLNPNFAADGNGAMEFTNRGGDEFGLTTTATAYQAEAIGDSSPTKAVGSIGVASNLTTTQEFLIEIDSRDITGSSSAADSPTSKLPGASRVSSQCPNDAKYYKLIMRFRNVLTPATNTNIVIQRILVVDNFEQRVQVSTGEGDTAPSKAVATNVTGSGSIVGGIVTVSSAAPVFPAAVSGASADPTAGTTGRMVVTLATLAGHIVVQPGGVPQTHDPGGVVLSTTAETTLVAALASNRHLLQSFTCWNPDTVPHTFIFRDATAGTVRWKVTVLAGQSSPPQSFPAGYPAAALNTNWTVQLAEGITTNNCEVYSSSFHTTA